MIDDDLRAVREIAELRFPEAEHVRIIERVTVIEPEDGGLGEEAVVNADARLFLREMEQRNVRLPRLRVVDDGVARAESSAPAVLPGKADRNSFEEQRSKRERFRVMPFVGAAGFENFAAPIEHRAANFRDDVEIFRHARQAVDDLAQHLGTDRGRRAFIACTAAEKPRSIP